MVADLDVVIRLAPENAETHLHRGHALSLLGKPEEALEALNEAVRLDTESIHLTWAGKYLHTLARPCLRTPPLRMCYASFSPVWNLWTPRTTRRRKSLPLLDSATNS